MKLFGFYSKTNTYGPQGMKATDFGDPLSFF